MKHNKKAGIHLFLLSFPKCQREKKNIDITFFVTAGAQKW